MIPRVPVAGWLVAVLCLHACQHEEPGTPGFVLSRVREGCGTRDVGMVMDQVDIHYRDDLGGPGRLEDDLRQLFTVYGELGLELADLRIGQEAIEAHAVVQGRAMRFEGPLRMGLTRIPSGALVRSGLLTDMRAIIDALRERRLALEKGAIRRLALVVSPLYQGEAGGKDELLARVERDLARVQSQAIMVTDLRIQVEEDRARVVQAYDLITRAENRTREQHARERLVLHKEGSLWRFVKGLG